MQGTHRIAGLFAALLGCLAIAPAAQATDTVPASWQKGFNFTSWTKDGYGSQQAADSLAALRSVGSDRVVLTPTWYMDTASSDTIARDGEKTPSDSSLETAMDRAKDLGMAVVLKPHVDVKDDTFRGQIAPADHAAWFASYRTMLLHYAELAQSHGADTLVVGTELTSMSTDTQAWDGLIAAARADFDGTLTYAANWIDEAEQVGFWDRLDAVGMDAYMPLSTRGGTPTVDQVTAAWTPYVQRISDLHARTGKPVMFTELGYQSRSDTLAHPASASGAPDDRIQEVAYTAALNAWRDVPWFQGIWWWNWEAEPTGEDPAGSFTIAGKPAASFLRAAQGGQEVASPGVDRMGMTVPLGAGVLLLMVVGGILAARRRRRTDDLPSTPAPLGGTGAAAPLRQAMPDFRLPAAPRPALTLAQAHEAPVGLAPAQHAGLGTSLPPQLAAACQVPGAYGPATTTATATRLPSRYQGVAA
jgi:hypothetical protein